mmetsp:Transcript_36820/g.59562  ORF Transcript_36820/g.59562 Transcript_36820/m.59562 type:complete len:751 (+) Transcript_36820:273-2525(+)
MGLNQKKKRKNTNVKSEVWDQEADLCSSDETDDEKQRLKTGSETSEGGGCMSRLFVVFVTVVCFMFYDVANVFNSIYEDTSHRSSLPTDLGSFKPSKAFKGVDLKGVIEDTKKSQIVLASAKNSILPVQLDFEKRRVKRLLEGLEDTGPNSFVPSADTDDEKKEVFSLFKEVDEVFKVDKKVNKHVLKRKGKILNSSFVVSEVGYDLEKDILHPGMKKIHGANTLEDYVELALRRAEIAAQKREALLSEKATAVKDRAAPTETKVDGMSGGETKSRELAFTPRDPDPAFLKFVSDIRADNTYAHINRKNDMERALKQLGYKQSTKSARKSPMWVGYESKCRGNLKKDETRILFCPLFVPPNKADQYSQLQQFKEKYPSVKLSYNFYPPTWRLYKEAERRSLKAHCTNESMTEFGVAYVRKFTVPGSNYMKSADSIYDQLLKSDKSLKQLTKETKNRAIVQLYINNPLLIEERKFIIRTFAVVVSTQPFIAYYSDGAVFRSIIKYQPFTIHDSDYKKAAHITSEQKGAHKGPLKSSALYTSFSSLQRYLTAAGNDPTYVNSVLRPQMKARMLYALYAVTKNKNREDPDKEDSIREETLPNSAAVVQTSCFDFLLDENKKLWLITVGTGSHCFVNMGGSSFRPNWKAKLQEKLSENSAKLGEEVLWRRMNKKPISTMNFFTQTGMTVLIDETFPDWNVTEEINAHVDGVQVAQDNTDYSLVETEQEDDDADVVVAPEGDTEESTQEEEEDDD